MRTYLFCLSFTLLLSFVPILSHGAAVSSYIYLHEYSVLSDGTIRDDEGWLKTDGSFTNVFRDDSGLLNMLGVTAATIAPYTGKPVLGESDWNAYAAAGLLPHSWVRSAQSYSFLDTSVVIVGVSGKTDPNPPITIMFQPQSELIPQGSFTSLLCYAQPWQYVSYQWRFKGKDIPGATRYELNIPNFQKTNAGIYQVALSTGSQPILSSRALLKMVYPAVLKTQPKSQTVKEGHGVTFRVTVKGTPPFLYTWYKDGQMLPQFKSFLSIPHADPTNAGAYSVKVIGWWNSVTSTNAVLTVAP